MSKVGYARVSTTDQDTSIQVEQLKAVGCDKVYQEQISGKSMQRPELEAALDYIREGDTLVVTRIDRLARSVLDLQKIVYDLKTRGIALEATEQPIDTSTAAGKAFLDMLGVFAEFETNLRKERQDEGIAKAKAEGKYKGRKATPDEVVAKVLELIDSGVPKTAIAKQTGICRTTVYRIADDAQSK